MCRFLTPKMVEKLKEFQRNGGILVGDELMLPALKPDVVVPVVKQGQAPAADHPEDVEAYEKAQRALVNTTMRTFTESEKAASVANGEKLRRAIAGRFRPSVDSGRSHAFLGKSPHALFSTVNT